MLLVTFSLHTSSQRWRDLQLQLEEREEAHRAEISTMQLKFKTKCGSSDKQIAALEKERDMQKFKLREKTQELSAKKQEVTQLQRAAKEAAAKRASIEQELADAVELNKEKEAAVAASGDELEEMKKDSFEALKSCRQRTGILKRGLQGSSAVLAERMVMVHQMNVTLLSVLAHLPLESHKEVMQQVVKLELSAADKQSALAKLRPTGRDLNAELEEAVQSLKDGRDDHRRLAAQFAADTAKAKEEEEKEEERLKEEAERKEREKEAAAEAASGPPPLTKKQRKAMKRAAAKAAAAEAEGGRDSEAVAAEDGDESEAKEEETGGEAEEATADAGGEAEEATADAGEEDADAEAEAAKKPEQEAEEDLGDLGDLDGGDGDDEKKRAAKLERAMRAEKTRQDQAKYWAKYHEKEEKAKARAKAAKQAEAGGTEDGAEEDADAADADASDA